MGLEPAAVLAVAEVESAGRVFWPVGGDSVAPARFEGHYFYKRLRGRQRDTAVAMGLAHPKSGRVKNPRSYAGVYAMIERAHSINPTAAYESCSWGLGQVMGANWHDLGFRNVFDLVEMCQSGADGQIEVMLRFIKKNNLIGILRARQWDKFAHRYNGPGYKRNNYAVKMAQAYRRWLRALGSGSLPQAARVTRVEGIRIYQKKLKTLGYYKGKVDGSRGRKTRRAIQMFQKRNGLVVDGIVGPMTTKTMDEQLEAQVKARADKALAGGLGSSLGGGTLEGARSQIPEPAVPVQVDPAVPVQVDPTPTSQFPQYQEGVASPKADKLTEVSEGIQTASDSLTALMWQTSSTILTVMVMVLAFAAAGLTMYGLYLKFVKTKTVTTIDDEQFELDLVEYHDDR